MPRSYVPVTWRLSPELFRALKEAAAARGKSVQSFAIEALQKAIGEAAPEQEEDIWSGIIGGGRGGPPDVATRHDYYLAEAYASRKLARPLRDTEEEEK